jgi:hypothetical protein
MNYEVRCECGKTLEVTGADAGASLRCGCGRTVDVPPLHQLRLAVGEEALSPAVRIETMLFKKQLPGTRECVVCFRETDDIVSFHVVCERGTMKDDDSAPDGVAGGCLFGCLVGGLPGLIGANRLMRRSAPSAPKQVGQDVAFTLPMPVCAACEREVSDPAAFPVALRHIPEYAALLDRYPNARITLVG